MKHPLIVLLFFSNSILYAQEYHLKKIEININASLRGLSVVNNNVAWVSGSEGWIGNTCDGGNTWNFNQVSNHETSDF